MKICFLIINYNGIKYLHSYTENILNFCKQKMVKLIITDDQSTDNSIEFLKQNKYDFTVNTGDKHGFSANVNHGLRYARKLDEFDYYLISNNDIELNEKIFEPLQNALISLQNRCLKPGIIGFEEINKDRYNYFKEFDYSKYSIATLTETNHIPGFFFLISKELIQEIGYFDEEYFMYGEDNDYFARAQKANFKIFNTFLPVMHFSEGSSTNNRITSWYVYRNAFLFAQKNMKFLDIMKLLYSFINIIYNPFYKSQNVSSIRIKRNGFFYNNYLLLKSIGWNLKYFFSKKFNT